MKGTFNLALRKDVDFLRAVQTIHLAFQQLPRPSMHNKGQTQPLHAANS